MEENKKELTVVRVYDAPRELVFKAWTQAQQMAQWFGPKDFTNPECKLDVRDGGKIHIVMRGPDGTDYPMNGEFKEIVAPEHLVFTTTAFEKENGEPQLKILNTITFTEEKGKTKLTLHAVILKAGPGTEEPLKGHEEGWNQSLDKLNKLLTKPEAPIVIERMYKASVEKIWKAISEKEQMKLWYFDLAEFRPEVGFEFEFLAGDDKKKFMHLCKVTEVIPNKKLQYSWRYEGFEGNSFVTWELFDENGTTRLRLTHEGLETFPASNPDFAKNNFYAGWTHILGISLKQFAEK